MEPSGESSNFGSSATPPAGQPRSSGAGIFTGPNGIRAGWRLLIFLAMVIACATLLGFALTRLPALRRFVGPQERGVFTPLAQMIQEGTLVISVFFGAFVMAKIEKRRFREYGIPGQGAFGKLFWQGVIWGLAMVTLLILLIAALHGFSFGGLALAGSAIEKYAALWAIVFLLVGFFEEFTFRGYTQFTLTTGMGFWPSAILLSAVFGAVHLQNPGEAWAGALMAGLFGVLACFTLRRTGNLWLAIGMHASFDYGETFIYSVPDSGFTATGHLLNSSFHGPRWLTGGSIGPEGSVMAFVVLVLAFLVFHWMYPAKPTEFGR